MAEKPCPFCTIDAQRNRVIWNGEHTFVSLSAPRLMEGHLLVIPRRHVAAPFYLGESARRELFNIALYYQEKLMEVFAEKWHKPAGCDVSWHTRPFMPRTEISIPGHAHVHLRPRFWRDPYYEEVLKHETDMFTDPSIEELDSMEALLLT